MLESDFYNPFYNPALNDILPTNAAHRYKLLKKLKETGISAPNTVICTRSYGPAVGGSAFFVWKEDFGENRKTQSHNVIEQIKKGLPKYSSRCHKKTVTETVVINNT